MPQAVANPVARIVANIIFFYVLILVIRIFLSWLPTAQNGRAWDLLVRVTDPYVNLFRGIRFLRLGRFDLTIVAGIVVLMIVQQILIQLAMTGSVRLSTVLAIIVLGIWGPVRFFMFLIAIASGIRAVGLYTSQNQTHPFWHILDSIVQPVANWFNGIVRNRLDYAQAVIGAAIFFFVAALVGNVIIRFLVIALQQVGTGSV